ncbi:hypothetical protein MKX03_009469 [Papaver bracteatum]|nr:hypothetical protein MKX03_009469 [Papaver bracteatum]
MADVRGGGKGCGCAVSCPGSQNKEHMKCSCGEPCGCIPCGCSEGSQGSTGVGKAYCKCGPGCGCVKCAS